YLMHGDPPERVAAKVADMQALREANGLSPLLYGVAGYVVCRATETAARREIERITDVRQNAAGYANYEQWLANTQLEQRVSLEDYSVSNRGLKAGLTGTPERLATGLENLGEQRVCSLRRIAVPGSEVGAQERMTGGGTAGELLGSVGAGPQL